MEEPKGSWRLESVQAVAHGPAGAGTRTRCLPSVGRGDGEFGDQRGGGGRCVVRPAGDGAQGPLQAGWRRAGRQPTPLPVHRRGQLSGGPPGVKAQGCRPERGGSFKFGGRSA